jgi:O6-methylguanine-DNA--protein-cysteine methyltransferase
MAGKLITAEIQDDIDVAVNQEPVEPVKVVKKTDAAAKRGKIRRDYKKHRLGFHMRNGKQLTVYKLDNGEDIEVLRDMSDRDWDKGTAALEEYIENRETDGRTARDSLLNGQMDTQKWARKALPILVRQAQKRKTITYGELAKKINSTTPRLGRTLGCIDFAIEELSKDWQRKIPHINALVVNNRGISGSGLPPYDELDDDTLDGKKRFMEKIHDDIFDYPDWIRVQNELLQTNR